MQYRMCKESSATSCACADPQTLANALDRIVSRGIFQILSPVFDPGFDPRSFGFRPRLGVPHALAEAILVAESDSRWHWVAHDLKDAFDRIPRERLLDLLRPPVVPQQMLDVIRRRVATEIGAKHCRIP